MVKITNGQISVLEPTPSTINYHGSICINLANKHKGKGALQVQVSVTYEYVVCLYSYDE